MLSAELRAGLEILEATGIAGEAVGLRCCPWTAQPAGPLLVVYSLCHVKALSVSDMRTASAQPVPEPTASSHPFCSEFHLKFPLAGHRGGLL